MRFSDFLVKGSGMGTDFTYHIVGRQSWDVYDDNMDVEIVLPTGERYAATFVTVENISSLFKKNRVTGECASGSYLWVADMIIVQRLEHEGHLGNDQGPDGTRRISFRVRADRKRLTTGKRNVGRKGDNSAL